MPDHLKKGQFSEQQACRYLEEKGLKLIEKNFSRPQGEIDLIMQDGDDIVFVEVRTRNQEDFGDAIDSITSHKQHKIIKAATIYLLEQNLYDKVYCRFDVIGFHQYQIDWIKDAFSVETL